MAGLRIAIVGSGFAGSILARVLQLQGHQVTLLDRGRLIPPVVDITSRVLPGVQSSA